jgi:periplasmic protein TonB
MALEYRTISGSTGSPVEVVTRDGVQHADPIPVLSADDTLPPTPIEDIVAAAGLQVHVLAADTAVRDGVRRACGERYAFTVADDWTSLLAEIDARRCDIAVIEASLLGARLEKCITDLGRNGRQAVTLVAADRKEAQRLIGFLSERRIHRLLIKPPAAGITRLLIESAANRCLQLRSAAVASPPVVTAPKRAAARIPTWLIAAGVAVLCLAVALAVASYRAGSGRNAGAAADQATAGAAAPIDRFADLVASAELAFSQGRLADPPGDNALDYYLNVLAAEPTHEKARDGLASVVDALFAQAENALLMGSLDAAATSLDAIRKTAPTSGRLAFLDAALARSRADAAKAAARGNDKAASAAPAATGDSSPAAQAELEKVLDTASTRLRRGELLEPAGDSALRNLDRATQLAGNDPRVIRLRSELAAALISSARTALDAGDLTGGVRLADAARTLGADGGAMSVLDQKIAAARVTQQTQRLAPLVAKARARIQAGALVPPAEDNALTILTAVERDAPQTVGLGDAFEALVGALASSVRAAVARSDWPAAESGVKALESMGHAPALTSSLARDLAAARLQEDYLATASSAGDLTLVNSVAAVYPSDAQFRQIEGWVEVEYVVDRSGLTRDLRVRQSSPAGRFEQSALAAVRKYRYEPFTRDGQIYERRVYVRIRFSLR